MMRCAVLSQLLLLLRLPGLVSSQGCASTCPPLNAGVPMPSLCENDLAEEFADIDRVYETCHPVAGDSFRFRDFMGEGKVTVISNFYIGCNAGRRETGVFTHVAQKYHDMYGDRTNFITSLKGGTNCQRWAGIWQLDSINMFPESGIVAKDVPYTVLDQDYALRDDFFTTPFGHPSYVILDGDLRVRHKFVGPCCGAEGFSDCSRDTAKGLAGTLSGYIDAILAETSGVVESAFDEQDTTADEEPDMIDTDPFTNAPTVAPITPVADCEVGEFSGWSECSVTCGDGLEFRWRTVRGTGCPAPVETRPCSQNACAETTAGCVQEFGGEWNVAAVASGFDAPRDVAFHPTPGHHLGNYSDGRSFNPDEGDEAWVVNAFNHSVSIVAALGSPSQTTISRRDRGYYHYMINATALAFNMNGNSGRSPDRDTFNYFAICNDDRNTYMGTKEPNNFQGPTLYNTSRFGRNLVNRLGEECEPDEECFLLHADMLHESPACIGMAHDPEERTAYGTVYFAFDSTGNQENGQLVRFDFQQPHGPGSMDHSVASVRRFPDVKLARGAPGVHAGMVVHPDTRELFISVPGENKIIAVHADSGEYSRTARQEYPIYSNALPSFEYSIFECPEQRDFATGIDTPSGLALSPDGERLFAVERGTGRILVFEVRSGSLLFSIDTGLNSIGGMSFAPKSQVLHFVDENTNTLYAVQPISACETPVGSRASLGFADMVQEAREIVGNSFSLYRDYTCTVDPQIPDGIYFDQVHDDGYASDNPDVQSEMAGMDAAAALLANRTDCEPDSDLNFDALLLGGYFCHQCLPRGGAECDPGGTCTNVQWLGYTCDNEFLIMKDNVTNTATLAFPNKTAVPPGAVVLRTGVTYRFTVKGDMTVCLHDTPYAQTQSLSGRVSNFGCATQGPLVATVTGNSARSPDQAWYLLTDDGQVLSIPVEQRKRLRH